MSANNPILKSRSSDFILSTLNAPSADIREFAKSQKIKKYCCRDHRSLTAMLTPVQSTNQLKEEIEMYQRPEEKDAQKRRETKKRKEKMLQRNIP